MWCEKYPELYDFQENKVRRGWILLTIGFSAGLFPPAFPIKATSTNERKHPLQEAPYSILAPWVLTIVWFLDSWPKVCWFYWSSESHSLAKVLMVNTVKKIRCPCLTVQNEEMDNTVAFDALWWDIWGIFFVFNQPHLGWVALLHLQKTELQFLMETEEGHWGGVSAQVLSEKCLLIQFCLWIAVIFWMEEGVRWPRVLNWWICRNRN